MPDRNEETGRFEATVDTEDITDLFDSHEPRSTREVATILEISRSRAYELLQEAKTEGEIAS
ncbi:orf75, partial [Halobacterium phage phiH]